MAINGRCSKQIHSSHQLSKMRFSSGSIVFMVALAVAAGIDTGRHDDDRDAKLFALYSTTTHTTITTTTITGLSTCLSVITTACLGRRKKRSPIFDSRNLGTALNDADVDIAGSKLEELEDDRVRREARAIKNGKGLTVWSTAFSTLTITSTSILPSTTVTVSALCSVPGVADECF